MSITRKSILVILLILLADQTLKVLVKTHMTLYEQIPLFGQWGFLHFVENNGMAFGLAIPGSWGKILLTSFRIAAVVGITFYLRHLIREKAHTGLIIALSMVMAGALGNIIDSVFYGMIFSESTPLSAATLFPEGGGYSSLMHGKVVDMFYFPIFKGNYPDWFRSGSSYIFFRPVFNIADSSITVAVFLILLNQKRFFRHVTAQHQESGTPASEQTEEPAEKQAEEPAEKQTEEPAEKQTEEPAEKQTEGSAEKQAEEPANEAKNAQAEEPIQGPQKGSSE